MRMWKPLFILFVLLLASPAGAQTAEDVRGLLTAGDYDSAHSVGVELGTAQGYALATEGLPAKLLLGEVDKINKHSK